MTFQGPYAFVPPVISCYPLPVLNAAWVVSVSLSLQTAPPAPAGPVPTDERPLTHLVQNLTQDLKSLTRPQNAIVLGAGVFAAGVSHAADDDVANWVRKNGGSLSYTPIGGLLGNEILQGAAAIGTYAIGRIQDSPTLAHIGSDLIRAQVLNGVMTTGLKLAADRERPNGGDYAFPSGHSSATFASAAVLEEHFGWKVGVPAYAVSAFVGWTRIRDNEHWVSDVVFGSALGIVAGKTVARGHQQGGWTITPSVTPGGAALYVLKR